MVNGEQIRRARTRMGLTQQELADRVGVSLRTIGNWERGSVDPAGSEARLVDVLGDYLVPGGNPRTRLEGISDMELLSELAARLGQRATLSPEAARFAQFEDDVVGAQRARLRAAAADLPPDDDLDDLEPEDVPDPVYGEEVEQRAARKKDQR